MSIRHDVNQSICVLGYRIRKVIFHFFASGRALQEFYQSKLKSSIQEANCLILLIRNLSNLNFNVYFN